MQRNVHLKLILMVRFDMQIYHKEGGTEEKRHLSGGLIFVWILNNMMEHYIIFKFYLRTSIIYIEVHVLVFDILFVGQKISSNSGMYLS